MKTSLILLVLILPTVLFAQLPKLGVNKYEFLQLIRQANAYYDSTVYDEKDIEGNQLTRGYKAAPFPFYGLNGCLTVVFDRKEKAITERWILTDDWGDESMIPDKYLQMCSGKGTIARVTMLKDSLSAVYGKPKKSTELPDVYSYQWKKKPAHTLSLIEGKIGYFDFSK